MSNLGTRRGYGLAAFFHLDVNRKVPLVRTASLSRRKSSKRVQSGEPIRLSESSPLSFSTGCSSRSPANAGHFAGPRLPVSIVARLAWPIMRSSTPADGPFEWSVRAISRTWRQPRAIGA